MSSETSRTVWQMERSKRKRAVTQLEGGSMYHAIHGVLIYYSRVYGADTLGPLAPLVPLLPAKKS